MNVLSAYRRYCLCLPDGEASYPAYGRVLFVTMDGGEAFIRLRAIFVADKRHPAFIIPSLFSISLR
ncbi:MAG: hypothetical protein ACLRP3_20820 [Escherichia sp.]